MSSIGTTVSQIPPVTQKVIKGRSLWDHALIRLKRDKMAIICFTIISIYAVIAVLAKLELIASPWDVVVGASYQEPSSENIRLWLGTDIFGRSVFFKVIHGTRIAMSVGLITAVIAVPFGVVVGAVAGYFGGWIDEVVVWFYTTLSSIPNIML
ncbi:MAG: ABC transporter permease, partial [Proteobacteria bacterium]